MRECIVSPKRERTEYMEPAKRERTESTAQHELRKFTLPKGCKITKEAVNSVTELRIDMPHVNDYSAVQLWLKSQRDFREDMGECGYIYRIIEDLARIARNEESCIQTLLNFAKRFSKYCNLIAEDADFLRSIEFIGVPGLADELYIESPDTSIIAAKIIGIGCRYKGGEIGSYWRVIVEANKHSREWVKLCCGYMFILSGLPEKEIFTNKTALIIIDRIYLLPPGERKREFEGNPRLYNVDIPIY